MTSDLFSWRLANISIATDFFIQTLNGFYKFSKIPKLVTVPCCLFPIASNMLYALYPMPH